MKTKLFQLTNKQWLTDSRQVTGNAEEAVFFAIQGEHHNGHDYIGELYRKGIRQFVVERSALTPERRAEWLAYADATFVEVDSSLQTLQTLAAEHRRQFHIPIIGITGSNGKTIVKEWLAQLLEGGASDQPFVIAKSPKSYNSQLGVPLSVHELADNHTLGIFEAGISKAHEMKALEAIIHPTIGIFTNVGTAHDEGFRTRKQKIAEKLRLFIHADTLIYSTDYTEIDEEINLLLKAVNPDMRLITWSLTGRKAVCQVAVQADRLRLTKDGQTYSLRLPFTDPASVENLIHCLVTMLVLRPWSTDELQSRLNRLRPVSMRLEQKEGINNSILIDDSYNNDVAGLKLALRFLNQQNPRDRRVVILSDVLQSGQPEDELYALVGNLMQIHDVAQFVGIGPVVSRNAHFFADTSLFYPDTEAFLNQFPFYDVRDSTVLVKGARPFSFERIVARLERKVHGTVLEINLDALTHNLNYYREKVGTDTKIMVMVKAFAYGSGSAEVAQLLQFHRVDYLGVAYADEGVILRQHGVHLPIMVMNPAPETFSTLLEYQLEPEIYSMRLLREWGTFVGRNVQPGSGSSEQDTLSKTAPARLPAPGSLHLKIDTGMHRLGFLEEEIPTVAQYIRQHPAMRVATVFSHLVGSDDAQFNSFSKQQYETFLRSTSILEAELGYRPTRHLLNSAGIVRFPDYRLDMVRLGIGLYGVEASGIDQSALHTVGTLRSVISQIKTVRAGESVGYSRRGVLDHDARIATIAIGYADGFDRRLGNGRGDVWVNGTRCPTVGNVCMDMTMIDVTKAQANEGDEVTIFGVELPITDLARSIETIPYEILTGISERVKRVFFKEGN
ncbi:bifunctional UDP-N-acetylmuramoyl-tripeptide:D-alanyl-D-alanine ligase/alanine racemase [Spirosoma sp. 48-14]|uniref:bifunctional UDP-N-acetylmuramoyl-tripeptide:D-alanyl-D-alanine ligase/alanine racemase n=1 Tax=Spirosoma sp. 48-14 TaxID=1895854 RepID=UPI00096169CC|nr:bifunctional UDP-N-acetylmuramoyl-tripeptide:D-alanyl-D-alanine ligase/alanine racemase [Spirosoma sp. 48-14]OJW76268.1 MAG: bifunctional UDP-N-acetylmuramoyl-tripeptide:D-alanyl-D-alanine ligase/alanine racemase [Spirosoma sp. 48-14]